MRTKIKTLNRFAFAGKGTVSGDMALDLIEAIELIKEMRAFIDYVSESTLDPLMFEDRVYLLEKSKEYAEHENEIDIAEKIYMSFGDNETGEATETLNQFAESYHQKKCVECNHEPFARFENRSGITTDVDS